MQGFSVPRTVSCNGIDVAIPRELLVVHRKIDPKTKAPFTEPQPATKNRHGNALKKLPDPTRYSVKTLEGILKQPEGKERGIADLGKVLADAEQRKAAFVKPPEDGKDPPPTRGLFDYTDMDLTVDGAKELRDQLDRLKGIMDLDRCLCADPGMIEAVADTRGRVFYTADYYILCGAPKRTTFEPGTGGPTHKLAKGMVPVPIAELEALLSRNSLQVADNDTWWARLRVHLRAMPILTAFYASKSLYGAKKNRAFKKQSTVDRFVHEFLHPDADGKPMSAVYFGAGYKGGAAMKGVNVGGSPIVKSLIRALATRAVVFLVDEAYTSQMCSQCKKQLTALHSARDKFCEHCWLHVDRDCNAALNIQTIVQHMVREGSEARPEHLPRYTPPTAEQVKVRALYQRCDTSALTPMKFAGDNGCRHPRERGRLGIRGQPRCHRHRQRRTRDAASLF